MKRKKKILIYGVSTFKNRGVEAIINSTLGQIDTKDYDITLASYDLPYNSNKYTDKVKYVDHYRMNDLNKEEQELEKKYQNMPFDYNNFELLYQRDVVKAIEDSDICISAGGDNYCYNPCTWLYALDKKSRSLGKKTVLWGSSLFEEIDDLELIENLNNFDVLVIRESLTLDAIKNYVDPKKIIFAKDPAFSMPTTKVELNEWYEKNKDFMILNVSPLTIKNETGYKAVVDLLKYVLKNTKYSICLLPHVTTEDCNDLDILNELKKEFSNNKRVYLEENEYDCRELKYIISKSKLVVAARTHASIAAYSTCVPTLVIGYSVKAKGIAKDLFGSYDDYVINSSDLTSELLIDKFNFINNNREKIINTLQEQMPKIKKETSTIFEKVIEKLEKQEQEIICHKDNCIGCGVCATVCPVNAITMQENKEGFVYPKIDLKKCIHCNKCRSTCPILNKEKTKEFEREVYAIKNNNLEERKKSTSGGVFSILAKNILSKKGIVYGCEMINNKAKHIRITKVNELDKIRGSKYIQSSIMDTYKLLKKDLDNKKQVLFSGTPCQIGAIKAFLGKEYSNLITVSVMCHGVMSYKLLELHLSNLKNKYNSKITEWNFRNKQPNPWNVSSVSYKVGDSKKVFSFMDDDLMLLYLKNVVLRENCYKCEYKEKNNVADLIIADYWGIEVVNKDFFDANGVSAVIINSQKGKKFYNSINIEKYAEVTNGNFEDVYKYNPAYNKQVECIINRKKYLSDLYTSDFEIAYTAIKKDLLEQELIKTKKELAKVQYQNEELKNAIREIFNSKRWKIVDKPLNLINRILRRKK